MNFLEEAATDRPVGRGHLRTGDTQGDPLLRGRLRRRREDAQEDLRRRTQGLDPHLFEETEAILAQGLHLGKGFLLVVTYLRGAQVSETLPDQCLPEDLAAQLLQIRLGRSKQTCFVSQALEGSQPMSREKEETDP